MFTELKYTAWSSMFALHILVWNAPIWDVHIAWEADLAIWLKLKAQTENLD